MRGRSAGRAALAEDAADEGRAQLSRLARGATGACGPGGVGEGDGREKERAERGIGTGHGDLEGTGRAGVETSPVDCPDATSSCRRAIAARLAIPASLSTSSFRATFEWLLTLAQVRV